jgi:polyphosphate glucokinase
VGDPALQRVGKKRWRRRVEDVLEQIRATFNPRAIYVGGGNARLLRALPAGATVVPNVTGLLGGVRMWQRETRASAAKR